MRNGVVVPTGRDVLLAIGLLYTLGCERGSHARATLFDAGAAPGVTATMTGASAAPSSVAPSDSSRRASADGAAGAAADSPVACVADPKFPGVLDLPEASAAAEVELRPGVRELLVVADSGHDGAAIARTIPGGAIRSLRLPLDHDVSDDVEGIAWRGGHLYAIVSSGYVQRFTPDGKGGLGRDGKAYPIAPEPFICHAKDPDDAANCGKNYEGLCLRAATAVDRCAGYVASKAEGWLGCLDFVGEKLVLDPIKPKLDLGLRKKTLSDCVFGAAGGPAENVLLVTTNIFGGSTTYRVREGSGALTPLDVTGLPSNEAIAIDRDGALYQFMDGNSDTSPALRSTCTGW